MRIGCTGHRNLPPATRRRVTARLAELLAERPSGELVAVTNLADGADQLFALTMLAAGGRLHVVIPSDDYERTFSEETARQTYLALLGLAETTDTLPFREPAEDAFLAGGRAVVDGSDLLLAVWDGQPAVGRGGTGDVVDYARQRSVETIVIWPSGATRS